MKLGELKKSLARMSADLDDIEVLVSYIENGKEDFDNLAFTGYSDLGEKIGLVCVLGTMKSACDRLKKGNLHYPDGSNPADDSFDLSG